jgi:hypothetical protein
LRGSIRMRSATEDSVVQPHSSTITVGIRQHTSAYASVRQHTSAYVRMRSATEDSVVQPHSSTLTVYEEV